MATLSRPRSPRPLLNAAWSARNSGTGAGAGTGTGPAAVSDSTTATFADKVGRPAAEARNYLHRTDNPKGITAQDMLSGASKTAAGISVPPAQQAQGRDVVNQGGQRGVISDQGRFQALGDAALSKLPAPVPQPDSPQLTDFMNRNPGLTPDFIRNAAANPGGPMTGGGPWPDAGRSLPANGFIGGRSSYSSGGGSGLMQNMGISLERGQDGVMRPAGSGGAAGSGAGDIESAISSLRGQLGMAPGSDAALAAGGGPGPAPGIAARLAGRMPMPQQPQPGQQPQANDLMAKFGAGRPNPYAEILRQRMNPAAGAGAGAALAGMGRYA